MIEGLLIGIVFLLLTAVLTLVVKIATGSHDSTQFRKAHVGDIARVAMQVKELHDSWSSGGEPHKKMMETNRMVTDLHRWHDQKDDDGVFAWYVRKSLEEKIEQLAVAISELAKSIQNGNSGRK